MFRLLLAILVFEPCLGENEQLIIDTTLGKLRGHHKLSFDGKTFSAFEGIPYAKPPVGDLRFKEPVPMGPWIGTWDARFTIECVQVPFLLNIYNMSGEENCLFINVYVPREKPNPQEKLEVLVHIHGGAFLFDSGHSYPHPDFWMDREIIYVTFNYRLGVFGFLSTEDEVIPGNNGMKDQVEALKWIKNNIASFGGNPESITLFGMSAGATSLHYHYLSPLSRGLFHRGFTQSGSALQADLPMKAGREKAFHLGDALNCNASTSQELVDCLRQRSIQQIFDAMPLFFGYKYAPFLPFSPNVDIHSKNPFLPERPESLMTEGKIADLPFFTSITQDEGMIFVESLTDDELAHINKNWGKIAPYFLEYNYTLDENLWEGIAQNIKDHYLGEGEDINKGNLIKFGKMVGDRVFTNEIAIAAKLHAKFTKSKVYAMNIAYVGERKSYVAHADDGHYYFRKMFFVDPTPNEVKMKDILIDMVIAFAKTGKPAIKGAVDWEPVTPNEFVYVNITGLNPGEYQLIRTKNNMGDRDFWVSQNFKENEILNEYLKGK